MAEDIIDIDSIDEEKDEEIAYGYILEVLTSGLYPEKTHVIREYIQNGYDAICKYITQYGDDAEFKIELNVRGKSIFIYDNGVGMDRERLLEYRKIGFSRKDPTKNTGFRGIGKLAGLAVAEKLIVTSKTRDTNKRHKIIFDAFSMLNEVTRAKLDGNNIPLSDLVLRHTTFSTEVDDDIDSHYTLVELKNIKPDSKALLDADLLIRYVGENCPVKLNPLFAHANEIETNLQENVEKYYPVEIQINAQPVYKPYTNETKSPQFIEVYKDDEGEELFAYCWFCEHNEARQYEGSPKGLKYIFKNFAIGDSSLTRTTIWKSTPERAYWFWGEIYLITEELTPSSDRTNFEHDEARDRLYPKISIISQKLNRTAGKSSSVNSAKRNLETKSEILNNIEQALTEGIPQELKQQKTYEIIDAASTIQGRIKHLPEEYLAPAREALEKSKALLSKLEDTGKPSNGTQEKLSEEGTLVDPQEKPAFYDIKNELDFSDDTCLVYDTIIQCIEDELAPNQRLIEKMILSIHYRLKEKFEE